MADTGTDQGSERVSVSIELRAGVDPIEGALRVEDGPARRFAGWLQLTSLLQDAARGGRAAGAIVALALALALVGLAGPASAHQSHSSQRKHHAHHRHARRRHHAHRKHHSHARHGHKGDRHRQGGRAGGGSAGALKLGVYDCMSFNIATNMVEYKESVKLSAGGDYEQAWDRRHATFVKPTHGTYAVSGSLITFHGGALAETPGEIHAEAGSTPFFALLLHGKPSGWSCYYVSEP